MTLVSSPFVFPIPDLLAEAGARRQIEVGALVDWGFELADVGPELHGELTLESASGVLVVRGPVRATLGLTCHRCLTEWEDEVEITLTEAIGFDEEEGDEPEEYALDGDTLDLEPILRDAVLLAAPLRPLCRDDCLGLCATCGADLNTGSCPGHDEESTSPFAVLRDLLEP